MAKTFNPNRVGGGTVSIVRAADGTYSLKETGFDQISSLNMIDLGAVATTTTAAKTETAAEKTGTTVEDQTKQAFLLPKQDRGDDPFTTEKMLKSATDVSKGLSEVETVSDRQKTESQLGARGTFDADTFDDAVGTRIKDPTESVFGRSTVSQEQLQRQATLPSVETPQEKLKVTSANVQKGLVEPPLKSTLSNLKDSLISGFNKYIAGEKTKINTEKGSEVTQAGTTFADARRAMTQPGLTDKATVYDPYGIKLEDGRFSYDMNKTSVDDFKKTNTLGISADPSKTIAMKQAELASGTITPRVPDAIIQGQPSAPAKNTFRQSVNTALKGVGEAVQFMSPMMGVVQALGATRNESASTTEFNKGKFNVVTSSGPMQGRIVGNDGNYDPANNLFHGMNRSSALGNLEKAGQKRIDNINKTLARQAKKGKQSQTLIDRRDKFERELTEYRNDKNDHNIKSAKNKGIDTSKLNPNEMRNVAETGNAEGNTGGKIVCTMMNESYGFGVFRNKIWMKFHGNIAPEYQKGYHKLFLPLVNYAKQKGITNKIIKNILEHIAVHSTIDMRQTLRGKRHTLGRLYRKVILPLCYWAGKK